MTIDEAIELVCNEYDDASMRHPPFHSAHEGYAVLKEEVDELWDEIKRKNRNYHRCQAEAIQVAAMALRFLVDLK